MDNYGLAQNSEPCPVPLKGGLGFCERPNVLEVLQERQIRLTNELQNINAALDALKKNPEVANILELISKAGR